jgi:hypothetical protein
VWLRVDPADLEGQDAGRFAHVCSWHGRRRYRQPCWCRRGQARLAGSSSPPRCILCRTCYGRDQTGRT